MAIHPNKQLVSVADYLTIDYAQTTTINVSKERLRENRVIAGLPRGPEIDAYRMLRTRVLQRMIANGWNTLGVTSPVCGEGKTLTSINLALSIAMDVTRTVLLIDADLRNPCVHRYFDLPASIAGLGDYLSSDIPLQRLLVHPQVGRCIVLPGGKKLHDSSERLTSPIMKALVNSVKRRYASRIVVFDLPPVLAADDTIAFSPLVDAVLVVVEDGRTKEDDLHQTMELLSGVNVIGTVLNKTYEHEKSYDYYYSKQHR